MRKKMKSKGSTMKTSTTKPKGSGKTMAKDKMTVRETMSEPKKMGGKRRKAMEERVF